MKVKIDSDLCVGDRTCVVICPEIFKMDGDTAAVRMKKVPEDLVDTCWDAVESCPSEAIVIDR